jgi:hypothetical protein
VCYITFYYIASHNTIHPCADIVEVDSSSKREASQWRGSCPAEQQFALTSLVQQDNHYENDGNSSDRAHTKFFTCSWLSHRIQSSTGINK